MDDLHSTAPIDARRQLRFSCDPTRVRAYVDGQEQYVDAQVIEVSKSGAQLIVAQPIPAGADVHFEIGSLKVHGHIRYCKQRGDRTSWAMGVLMGDIA